MAADRIMGRWLAAFLTAVGLVLALAGWQALRPISPAEAAQRLRDGDCERAERLALLRQVRAVDSSADRAALLAGAMAAVALEDDEGFRTLAGRLASGVAGPLVPADASLLPDAALGEPALLLLLQGMVAESAGRRDEAAERYAQAVAGAPLWGLQLAHRLASDGLARLR